MKGLHTPSKHLRRFRNIGDVPTISIYSLRYIPTCGHEAYSIGMPASLIFFAVPPDPSRRTPCSCSPFARSRSPLLSYTDRSACHSMIELQAESTCTRFTNWLSHGVQVEGGGKLRSGTIRIFRDCSTDSKYLISISPRRPLQKGKQYSLAIIADRLHI